MICNETNIKVQELIAQGLVENVDFRVMYFSNKTEVQMIIK